MQYTIADLSQKTLLKLETSKVHCSYPFDMQLNAYIATSDIAGEGLFANRDIGTGSIIVIYSG